MNTIITDKICPLVFSEENLSSEIWNEPVVFEKGRKYLVEAVSGKGKSSLFGFIYGYRTDYNGELYFDEENIHTFSSEKWDRIRIQNISLLFQELRLFGELTGMENVELKNRLTSYFTGERIRELFRELDVEDKKDEPCSRMSWGQQQRIALIRSLCQPFDFLLLDEPVSHLDERNAKAAAKVVETEISRTGAGLIVTSVGKQLPLHYDQIYTL
jgi:ABC-type antimicrobial peptide transport system, ATPase component